MSKEKKKRGTGQRSGKKLVPRITIPLDEYEFLRDVVDAARSVSEEKSIGPALGEERKEAMSTHNPYGDTPSSFPALRREPQKEEPRFPTYTNPTGHLVDIEVSPARGTRVLLGGVEIKALVGFRLTHRVDGVATLELELHPSEYRITGAAAIVTEQVSEERTIEVHSYKDAEPTNPPSKDQKWRVVRADGYSRSGKAPGYDETWASDPSDYATAATYAKDLNDGDLSGEYFYRVVHENYTLFTFQP